jgi:hypothetical protein
MNKYLTAAFRGFVFGYFLGLIGFLVIFLVFWWHGWFTTNAVFDAMRQIFFSRLQYGFLLIGAFFAVYCAIYANNTVRRADSALRRWSFITSFFERR